MLVKEKKIEILEKDITAIAPFSEPFINQDKEMFSLMCQFMRNPNRDIVSDLLKHNKPSEQYLMAWLESNLPINKLLFIDGHVKHRWSKDYFYELLAYSIRGDSSIIVNYPRSNNYAK
tara:strand:+ start:367 stop:720 length:354 start_codon:yes stop_codon:yes gene_type:complete